MRKSLSVLLVTLLLSAARADEPVVHNPLDLEKGTVGTFPPPQATMKPVRKVRGGVLLGEVTYTVVGILEEKDTMLVNAFVEHRDGAGEWKFEGVFFFVVGLDTSGLADKKKIPMKGTFKVTGTRRLRESTRYVVELVK